MSPHETCSPPAPYSRQEPSPDAAATLPVDRLLADISGQINDIDALEAPDDLAADVDTYLTDARTTVDSVRASGADFFAQQASGSNPFADTNARAIQRGFKACGE